MALAPGIPCDGELLETLRLALSKISPKELEDYARSTPGFLNGGFRATKAQLLRARIASMLASSEPVDERLRALLRDQVRRSLEAGGANAALQRELESARASLDAMKGADVRRKKESLVRAALEAKTAKLQAENAALLSERGALRQRLERAEAEVRSRAADAERRVDALLQTRMADEMARLLNPGGAASGGALAGATPAGRIAAAIDAARDESLAAWRSCLALLASAGAFEPPERDALALALRRRFARIHAAGVAPGRDEAPSSPQAVLRRAVGGEIPAILLLDAHNVLFALQCRYRLPGEHRWPTAQARDWLVRDIASLLAGVPNVRAYVVFDGPERSEATASANVQVIYSGGEGEHRADGVIVDQAKFLAGAGAENILLFTNDCELSGLASRHGAKTLPPTALLPLLPA